jgi:hypothetical protein
MKKSQLGPLPEYFDRYINLVTEENLITALEKTGLNYFLEEREKIKYLGNKVYAPGKWTAQDILQHIIDTERVFTYRALRFSRNDKTELPGYEENLYGETAEASKRHLNDILEDYQNVRKSTVSLFKSFNEEQLQREGIASGKKMSVLAIGFMMVGHVIHHANVMRERYYPLLKQEKAS